MYTLIDLSTCSHHLRIPEHDTLAFIDRGDAAVAGISRNGWLVFQNRVFLRKHGVDGSELRRSNIREVLPELWCEFSRIRAGAHNGNRKIVDLFLPGAQEPIGHLFIAFERPCSKKRPVNLRRLVDPDHPDFVRAYSGLYVADPDAFTLRVNPSYEKIAFLPECEVIGRNLRELEEKGYFSQSVTLRVLSRLEYGQVDRITLFQKIITGKNVVVTGTPVYSEEGKLTHVLTFVEDLIRMKTLALKCEKRENSRPFFVPPSPPRSSTPARHGMLPEEGIPAPASLPFVAKDPAFLAVIRQVTAASRYDAPILLLGETGVGKDLLAGYLHALKEKEGKVPFVTVNCSAIPKELLESELFGYEEGAFSGARKGGKPGLFEEAHGGILFLNEISEIPLSLQAKLLTALDEGCIRRVGGNRTKKIKVRVVCATNRDLFRCVEQGTFRDDLYYRINVLTIQVPPLRERRKDILPLLYHFMRKMSERYGFSKYFSAAAQEILLSYSWPGNVRELKNLVERLVVFSSTDQISISDFPPELLRHASLSPGEPSPLFEEGMSLKEAVRRFEKRVIEEALRKYGKVSEAAVHLGIDPTTLTRKMRNRR